MQLCSYNEHTQLSCPSIVKRLSSLNTTLRQFRAPPPPWCAPIQGAALRALVRGGRHAAPRGGVFSSKKLLNPPDRHYRSPAILELPGGIQPGSGSTEGEPHDPRQNLSSRPTSQLPPRTSLSCTTRPKALLQRLICEAIDVIVFTFSIECKND